MSEPLHYRSALGDAAFEFAALVNAPRASLAIERERGVHLTWMQTATIWHIAARPGIRQLELVRLIGIGPSTMSKLCIRLMEMGLITLERSADDHRSRDVRLTAEGDEVARTLYNIGDGLIERSLTEFSETDLSIATHVLRALTATLR